MKLLNVIFLGLATLCLLFLAFGIQELRREVAALAKSNEHMVLESEALRRSLTKDEVATIGGERFIFRDAVASDTIRIVAGEVATSYAIADRIAFNDGDVVLDVGANIGMVSAYLGRRHPNIKIYAFEPAPTNYRNLVQNLLVNRIDNVVPAELGIGDRDGTLRICMNPGNTGGSRVGVENCDWNEQIKVVDVNRIFSDYRIEKVRLLKIDCEGCEAPFFRNITQENLRRIEYITGELHCDGAEQDS
jgi:FkbM family methyltransferase